MVQYTDSYSSCPSDIQNIVANDIALLEEYVLMQTGQYEWTAQIHQVGTNKTRELVFTRSSANYNNVYIVKRNEDITFESTYTNEYYVFSNMGFGKSLDLPVYDGVTSWCLMIICCVLLFAIVFKGALFKCLDKRR